RRLLPAFVGPGGGELDVIGLRQGRREAHIHRRSFRLIDSPAFVIGACQTERIENLHLIAPLLVNAAVAAGLPTGLRHVRQHELEVERVVTELVFAREALAKVALLEPCSIAELREIALLAREEDDGTARRIFTERFALALHSVQRSEVDSINRD